MINVTQKQIKEAVAHAVRGGAPSLVHEYFIQEFCEYSEEELCDSNEMRDAVIEAEQKAHDELRLF